MNYLKEILSFNDYLKLNDMSTGVIALWYALMYINNKAAWQEWFTASNQSLEDLTGLSRQAILKNRNALKQRKLIEFTTNKTKATSYKIIPFESFPQNYVENNDTMSNSCQVGCQVSCQDSCQVGCQVGCTLNKQETETINNSLSIAREEESGRVWLRCPIKLTDIE